MVTLPAVSAGSLLTLGVAAAVALVAFVAAGGQRLERTTDVHIALMLGGTSLAAAAIAFPRRTAPARLYGGVALLGVAALAVLTAVSIVWSLAPADSWIEANRTFAYLATFLAGLALARLVPGRWGSLLAGLGLGCTVVCGWALLTKVFPGSLAPEEIYARLREPLGYWNAVGLMAALGVPPLLWLAARRSGHTALNALAWPGLGVLFVCLMLSYSRGGLLALVVGLAVWFAAVPLRLRAAAVLAGTAVPAGAVVAWTFSRDPLTEDRLPLALRTDAGHELGALLALMVAVLLALGLAGSFALARRPPSPAARDRAGRALAVGAGLLAVAVVSALAAAPGGLTGQVSSAWEDLTSTEATTPANTPDRLTATSSVRARYWDEALDVHAVSPWVGTGAGAFATVRTRFREDTLEVRHAHGYVVQSLADLGWLGLAVSLAALIAWLLAAARATGLRPRDRGLPFDAERVGLLTLVAVVVVFGVHSTIDWTWFVPANAAVAMVAAGWVAGRGPLRARLEAARAPAPPERLPLPPGADWRLRARRVLPSAPRGAAAVAVIAAGVAAAWAAYQPVRAVHAGDAAIEALEAGQLERAAGIAMVATERNPLSVEPLWELAFVEDVRGRRQAAEDALAEAVALQPANAEAWRRLGRYQLSVLSQPTEAARSFAAAYFLDPQAPESRSDLLEARRALAAP